MEISTITSKNGNPVITCDGILGINNVLTYLWQLGEFHSHLDQLYSVVSLYNEPTKSKALKVIARVETHGRAGLKNPNHKAITKLAVLRSKPYTYIETGIFKNSD